MEKMPNKTKKIILKGTHLHVTLVTSGKNGKRESSDRQRKNNQGQ